MAALGATLKVKMDTSAVRRGLARIRGMFSRLGGFIRGFGGLVKRALLPLAGLFTGFALAAKRTADFGSEMSDLAVQTGLAVDRLIVLGEAMRRAGVRGDTGRILSTMRSNIEEGLSSDTIRRAFTNIGINPRELLSMDAEQAFSRIIHQAEKLRGISTTLNFDLEQIFGARISHQLLKLTDDYAGHLEAAEKSAGKSAKFFEENKVALDAMSDAIGRIPLEFKAFIGRLLIATGLVEKITQFIDNIDVHKIADRLEAIIEDPKAAFIELFQWLKGQAVAIGEAVGAGIRRGLLSFKRRDVQENIIKGALPMGTPKKILEFFQKGILGLDPIEMKSKDTSSNQRVLDVLKASEGHLRKMTRMEGAQFA